MTQQKLRIVKVSYGPSNPDRPFLRLLGLWLKDAGFDIGQRVLIQVSRGKLVIEPFDVVEEEADATHV